MKIYKLLFTVIIILVSSINILQAQSKKVNKLLFEYQEASYWKINRNNIPIIKWENNDTIKYQIVGEMKYISRKSFKKYLLKLEELTNLEFVETNRTENSNIIIYFGELKDYFDFTKRTIPQNILGNFDNWSNRKYNDHNQLTHSSFCIVTSKTKNTKRGRYNIKKLFLKSIGLLGSLPHENSIFYKYNTTYNSRLSKNDKRIIKIHYDINVKAGMTKSESIKAIKENINIENLIDSKI